MDLTIYQIRKDWKDIDSIVISRGLVDHEIDLGGGVTGYLYIKKPRANPPKWGKLFTGYVDLREFGRGASPAAVLMMDLSDRWYAITFGLSGRFLIDQESVEERFGLLTVLNSIPDDRIRSIDKTALDARATHSRVQTNQEASPQDFGLDIERDLVRAVTGTPTNDALGQRLHGADPLRATLDIELDELPVQIEEYAKRARAKTYKKFFSWIDHIAEVKDSKLRTELDTRLVSLIRNEEFDKCWMAVPQLIDWGKYTRFRYGGYRKRNLLHHDISLQSWLDELNTGTEGGFEARDMDLQLLEKTRVRCLNEDEQERHTWSAYKCIYAELDYKGHSFLTSSGKWYRIERDFVQEVNDFYSKIDGYDDELPIYNDKDEPAYNARVAAEGNGGIALMDQKIIYFGGGSGKVEFCDLFTQDRDIIHVKRYSQSSGLSHLFSQGTVSGELFRVRPDFRGLVNDRLPDTHKLADYQRELDRDEYRVVYAVVSRQTGDELNLPFFSRLNLRAAVSRLRGYGYRVALAKISIDHQLAVTKKYAS